MSAQLATIDRKQNEVTLSDEKIIAALRDSLYPGARPDSVAMVLSYCKAAQLDPMTKPVHIVPMSVKDSQSGKYVYRDVVMPGIELYRIKADRTGRYAGQDDAEFGPDVQEFGITYPQWCKVTVYKITEIGRVAYSAKVFWKESYSTAGKESNAPNAMWKKRPYGQLEKCAEAAALRKGFPEIGAQPTADEMHGKTMENEERDMGAAQVIPDTDPPATSRTEAVKAKLAKNKTKPKPEPATHPVRLDAVIDAIYQAQDLDQLNTAGEQAKPLEGADRDAARAAYKTRQAEIKAAAETPQQDDQAAKIEASLISAASTAATEEDRAEILDAARDLDDAARDRITAAFPAA